jgi:hypothetical protein
MFHTFQMHALQLLKITIYSLGVALLQVITQSKQISPLELILAH